MGSALAPDFLKYWDVGSEFDLIGEESFVDVILFQDCIADADPLYLLFEADYGHFSDHFFKLVNALEMSSFNIFVVINAS